MLYSRSLRPKKLIKNQNLFDGIEDIIQAKDTSHEQPPKEKNGVSTTVGRTTKKGIVVGSPEYMSPEQWHDKELDFRADIYSLGVLLFEMLTGCLPFEQANSHLWSLFLAHTEQASPDLKYYAEKRNFPYTMNEVVRKAMAKKREERYPDVNALKQAFLHLLPSDDVIVEGPSKVDKGKGSSVSEISKKVATQLIRLGPEIMETRALKTPEVTHLKTMLVEKTSFRELYPASNSPANAGECLLRPKSDKSLQKQLALTALREGVEAFDKGEGDVESYVVDTHCTLDDMLALTILMIQQHAPQTISQKLNDYALYTASIRQGLISSYLSTDKTMEALFRILCKQYQAHLQDLSAARAFLGQWTIFVHAILHAAENDEDPKQFSIFKATNDTFLRERLELKKDRKIYEQDLQRGEQWIMDLGDKYKNVGGLFLKEPLSLLAPQWSREPGSMEPFIKVQLPGWQRAIRDFFQLNRHIKVQTESNLFLAVLEAPSKWTFSTDPAFEISLAALAHTLQIHEEEHYGALPKNDPWYDGKRHGFTIIGSPHQGTKIPTDKVLQIVKETFNIRLVSNAS